MEHVPDIQNSDIGKWKGWEKEGKGKGEKPYTEHSLFKAKHILQA